MKKVLLIAYNFPPARTVGALRPIKFAKYLSLFGWEPVVLTVKESHYGSYDYSLLDEMPPSDNLYRTLTIEPYAIYRRVKAQFTQKPLKRAKKWRIFIRSLLPVIPDNQIGWLPFACRKAIALCSKKQIDALFTTSPPHSTHLIGLLLKKLTGKPWIADFRDPWTQLPRWIDSHSRLEQHVERFLEHSVVLGADKVITNTEPMRLDFLNEYSDVGAEKYVTITNGFDEEDFLGIKRNSNEKFTIVYTGSINFCKDRTSPRYNPESFLKALAQLRTEIRGIDNEIQVIFAGGLSEDETRPLSEFLKFLQLEDIVKYVGYTDHRKAIEYMVNADVLLLLHYSGKGSEAWIPAKTFEYLRAMNPILALVPDKGAVVDILKTTKQSFFVSPDDIDGIKRAIYILYSNYKKKSLTVNPDMIGIQQFERRELTKRLVEILDSVSSRLFTLP